MNASEAGAAARAAPLARLSWAVFELGRNPSFVLISLYIFAPYFAREIVGDPVRGQALWGNIQGFAGLAIAFSAPLLGAVADAGGRRKPWIAGASLLLMVSSLGLWFGIPGGAGLSVFAIGVLIALYNVGYDASIVFHGAMLSSLAEPARIGRLSGLGYALGNVATFFLLVFFLAFIALPAEPLFGLDRDAHEHDRIAGPIAALWFAVFCLPFFLWTPDRPASKRPFSAVVRQGLNSLARTVKSLDHYRNISAFLFARMIYNDGLNVMLGFGGVYAAGVFGWRIEETGLYGILLSPFAALGGYFGGRLADRIGARRALQISLTGTIVFAFLSLGFAPGRMLFVLPYAEGAAVTALPFFETGPELGYLASVCVVAMCLVASYANSRTMMARIAPEARMTEFFGLYALSGEATAFAAPFVVALATGLSGSQQWGMAAILVFLAAGLFLLRFVKEERATAV